MLPAVRVLSLRPLPRLAMMKSSIAHLPDRKQRELARVLDILFEEFADALEGGSAEFKKKGRILKVILFGSYARGGWVDEPHTMKGYRSDFDLLIIVNNRKLADFASYWYKARDRLSREPAIQTPVSFIVHSRREVNGYLRDGQYFFSDIRREGVVLYELDEEPLVEPKPLTAQQRYETANEHVLDRLPHAQYHVTLFQTALRDHHTKHAAFELHQALEQAYSVVLLALTNYSPPSHNLSFLRSLAEEQDRRLAEAWPRDQQRFRAWFNTLNEAYVKSRYSRHYEISEEALVWLGERTAELHRTVEQVCREHLETLEQDIG